MRYKSIVFLLLITAVIVYGASTLLMDYKKKKHAFDTLEERIRAAAADFSGEAGIIVKDLDTHWQVAIRDDASFPSASLVKAPIMVSCFYAQQEGAVDLEETIRLRGADKVNGSGVLKSAASGEEFTLNALLELMIVESDNTAANMLIKRLGFGYLNKIFVRLGLQNTNIDRLMMDFKKRKKGIENYTTARDMAFLLEAIYRGIMIDGAISRRCLDLLKKQKARDRIPARLPKDTVVAHKTGLERGVCHDMGVIFTRYGDLLVVVLTKHKDPNSRNAKKFIARIASFAYSYAQEKSRSS